MHASMIAFLPTYIQMETGNLWLAGIALTLFEAAEKIKLHNVGKNLLVSRKRCIVSFQLLE